MRSRRIIELFELHPQPGEIGIEIEMEGSRLAVAQEKGLEAARWPWMFKADGSLRGESCEWVLDRPVARGVVGETLEMLWHAAEGAKAKFNPSRRCGVHIHVNVQQMTEQETFNYIGMYLAFENLLVRWAGEDREGNLFCLRASDARDLIDRLVYARQVGSMRGIMGDQVRYASINVNALGRYGSLEFRALPTPTKPQRIQQWARMLWCLKDASLQWPDLKDMVYQVSAMGPREFIAQIFGQRSLLLAIEDREDLLREGIRNVQDLMLTRSMLGSKQPVAQQGWHVQDPGQPRGQVRWQPIPEHFNPRWGQVVADHFDHQHDDPPNEIVIEPDLDEEEEEQL